MNFHKDVVIDLVCYRRLGHNEADEPAATQPMMYQVIRSKPTTRQIYAERLVAEGVLSDGRCARRWSRSTAASSTRASRRRKHSLGLIGNKHTVDWSKYLQADWTRPVRTGVRIELLRELAQALTARRRTSRCIGRSRASCEDREQDGGRPAAARLGLCRDAGLRDAARPKATRSA